MKDPVKFIMENYTPMACWGEDRLREWFDFFHRLGGTFVYTDEDDNVKAICVARIVSDPQAAVDDPYYYSIGGDKLFVDLAVGDLSLWSVAFRYYFPKIDEIYYTRFHREPGKLRKLTAGALKKIERII